MKKLFVMMVLVLFSVALAQYTAGDVQDGLTDEVIEALQAGGHVIYIRHASTEIDYADQVEAILGDCATQRSLSEYGWHQARAIGKGFVELEIPVGKVISSQYCRAWQTADLAFGTYEKNADFNFLPFEDYTDNQVELMRKRVAPYLSAMPAEGTNVVIVAHDDPFEAATGIYPEPQGTAYIVKPMGEDGFELVARVTSDAWHE